MRKFYKLFVLFMLCQAYVFAQNVTVTGKVIDAENQPVPAVTVKVSGSSVGTSTDMNGNYSISVPANSSLVFSSIGYLSQTANADGRSAVNITLASDSKALEAVVVTALGIEKSAKSLTYATTNVSAEQLNQVKGANVLNSLAGKAAGVFVTQGSGGPGSSPRIILRGNKSIVGTNEPLYVVDGVPLGFSDFNPEDIESLQILQGASAAALYGGRAANGVILITTKKGKSGATNVEFASTATFDNPLELPNLQTTYGQGLKGVTVATPVNDSWGPKISNGSDSHIRDFFRTGQNYINSLSVSSGNADQRIYFSYANTTSKAMIPNYDYNRHNVTVRGNTKLFNNKVTVNGGVNYIKGNTENQNSSQWYGSPMFGLYLFPMGDDMSKYSPNGGAVFSKTRNMWVQNWPYIKNEHSSNQNPYWIQNRVQGDDLVDRTIFNGGAKWDINSWLNVAARTTFTKRTADLENRSNATSDPILVGSNGSYSKIVNNREDSYSDILLNGNKSFGTNITLNATAGVSNTSTNSRIVENSNNGGQNTLSYPNFFSVYGLTGNFTATESLRKTLTQAVFGTTTLGFKETLFLDLTARNEWSSTVDNSFFYPSAGLSYILTETLGASDLLSFAKIRGSYAEVGNDIPFGAAERNPYYTIQSNNAPNTVEIINGRNSLPFFSGTDTTSLRPERTKSYEVGADFRFFRDKLNLGITYYNATTEDQVFSIAAPSGSGATNFWINGGTIQNRGLEASLSYDANFGKVSWTPSVNFSRNTNRIKELSNLLTSDRLVLNSGNRLTNLFLLRPGSTLLNGREYGAYHDLFAKTYVRDADGNKTFNATTGLPILSTVDNQYLGNANPDFLLNLNNQFGYKNFTLSFLVDGRFGGLVSSSTEQWLDYKGLSKRSGEARDAGGVMLNGKMIDAETYFNFISAKADFGAAGEEYVFDSTNIRLRELALGFKLPKFSNAVKNLSLSLVGRNLFFFQKDAPFDPELAIGTENNRQGFEAFQIPSAKSWGLTLRAGL